MHCQQTLNASKGFISPCKRRFPVPKAQQQEKTKKEAKGTYFKKTGNNEHGLSGWIMSKENVNNLCVAISQKNNQRGKFLYF